MNDIYEVKSIINGYGHMYAHTGCVVTGSRTSPVFHQAHQD